jgi:hypothetical protein
MRNNVGSLLGDKRRTSYDYSMAKCNIHEIKKLVRLLIAIGD